MKYRKDVNGKAEFDPESFKASAAIVITAMEIAVGNSSYPTPAIEQNSFDYRPPGIGFANLGALLMSRGLPYDSQEGRNMAGAIMALLSGHTYYQSAKIAEKIGPFAGYKMNERTLFGSDAYASAGCIPDRRAGSAVRLVARGSSVLGQCGGSWRKAWSA